MKNYINTDSIEIHKINFKGSLLYFIHTYNVNVFNKTVDSGNVYMVHRTLHPDFLCSNEQEVLSYKVVYTIDEKKFVEIENIFIQEAYRGKGLGSILLKYFETKIIARHFSDIECIRGILLLGSENKLKRFYKRNGYEINDSQFKKRVLKI